MILALHTSVSFDLWTRVRAHATKTAISTRQRSVESGFKNPKVQFKERLKFRRLFLSYSLKILREYIKTGHDHFVGSTYVWLLLTAVPFRTVNDDRETRVPSLLAKLYERVGNKGRAHNHQPDHQNVFKYWHVVHKPPVLDALSTHTCLVCCVVWRPRSRNNWSSRRLASWRASRLLTLLLPNEIIIVATAERRSRQSAQTTPPPAPTSVPHWITRSLYLPLSLQASPSTTSLLDHPEGL